MKQPTIQYREMIRSDYSALEKIICETWNYEKFCTPKTAAALSKLFLASCLANQTYTCVALNGDEPVGMILGKNEKTHHTPLRYAVREFLSILAMLARKEGRRVLNALDGYEGVNQTLYAENAQTFDGEVALFAVRADQRGTGVGKELFHRLQLYMQSQKISDFYLYTDTTCNYGFYEHQGMERLGEKSVWIKAHKKETSFFLYGFHSMGKTLCGDLSL